MSISENISALREEVPDHVRIVAVSKTMAPDRILEAYRAGQRAFGENRVQELLDKQPVLPNDVEWHFIGHIQTNKVKLVVPLAKLIHSVDSSRLLEHIDKEGRHLGRKVECLLQVKIAEEESKFGLQKEEATMLLFAYLRKEFRFIKIRGLMGMATFTGDRVQVRKEFEYLAAYFHELKRTVMAHDDEFRDISMGMSGDYRIAVEAGSTMVRIGSLIFGERGVNQRQ